MSDDYEENGWIVEPMPGRVLVKLYDKEQKYGSIWIPDTTGPERPIHGEVIEVCKEYTLDGEEYEPLFKVGDIVVFGRYSGTALELGRKKLLVIREKDVLARLHNIKREDLVRDRLKLSERD